VDMSLFTAVIDLEKVKAKQFLDQMEQTIPWDLAIKKIEPYYVRKGTMGRPQTEIKTLLKMMCLQQWYNLSDESVEDQATDRISFRRFLGLGDSESPIDATTICKFRALLTEYKILSKIQESFTQELVDSGVILKEGTCVDATIVTTSGSTKNKEKRRDKEMKSTRKNKQYYFGAKAHISQDQKTKLIKKVRTTPANVSDSRVFEQLLDKDERAVFADKGYFKKERKQRMRTQGRFCGILHKMTTKRKMPASQKKRNNKLASARSGVEFPFGIWKHLWGNRKLRYKGVRKNSEQFHLLAFLSNCFTINQKQLCPI
jgi:transposase, IS5 family